MMFFPPYMVFVVYKQFCVSNLIPDLVHNHIYAGSITSPASYKRGKRPAPRDEMERFDEEEWLLRDVIFVEDTRPVPIGEVLAVDGNQVLY